MLLLGLVVHCPVGLTSPSTFIADPADGMCRPSEDHDVGVVAQQHLRRPLVVVVGEWVDLAGRVGTAIPARTAIGTVEPVLEELPIVRRELTDLLVEGLLILGEAIAGIITIPRG